MLSQERRGHWQGGERKVPQCSAGHTRFGWQGSLVLKIALGGRASYMLIQLLGPPTAARYPLSYVSYKPKQAELVVVLIVVVIITAFYQHIE